MGPIKTASGLLQTLNYVRKHRAELKRLQRRYKARGENPEWMYRLAIITIDLCSVVFWSGIILFVLILFGTFYHW